jgi:hypothetical protein
LGRAQSYLEFVEKKRNPLYTGKGLLEADSNRMNLLCFTRQSHSSAAVAVDGVRFERAFVLRLLDGLVPSEFPVEV